MNSNPETVDGVPVDLYEGKFVGAFDLPVDFAQELKMDDVGVALVTYIVTEPGYKRNAKSGEVKRILKLQVMGWAEVDQQAAATFVGHTNPVVVNVP